MHAVNLNSENDMLRYLDAKPNIVMTMMHSSTRQDPYAKISRWASANFTDCGTLPPPLKMTCRDKAADYNQVDHRHSNKNFFGYGETSQDSTGQIDDVGSLARFILVWNVFPSNEALTSDGVFRILLHFLNSVKQGWCIYNFVNAADARYTHITVAFVPILQIVNTIVGLFGVINEFSKPINRFLSSHKFRFFQNIPFRCVIYILVLGPAFIQYQSSQAVPYLVIGTGMYIWGFCEGERLNEEGLGVAKSTIRTQAIQEHHR